jgi:hypothetical protein
MKVEDVLKQTNLILTETKCEDELDELGELVYCQVTLVGKGGIANLGTTQSKQAKIIAGFLADAITEVSKEIMLTASITEVLERLARARGSNEDEESTTH